VREIQALMSPGGHSFEGPRLVALVADAKDHHTIMDELSKMLEGNTQVHTCPTSNGATLLPTGKRTKDLRIVVLNAENLSAKEQKRILVMKDERLPPTVLVVNEDPGNIMSKGAWSVPFRMAVYRTFNWEVDEPTPKRRRSSRRKDRTSAVPAPAMAS
jgi:hypothetical protein